jgi:hypothetical protein
MNKTAFQFQINHDESGQTDVAFFTFKPGA